MKWPYNRYEVDESRICPLGIVFRPEAKLRVQGASGDAVILALVDTGADHTLLPLSVAEIVGAELFEDDVDVARGVSGEEIAIIPGRVRLEFLSEDDSIAWTATVGFADFAGLDAECSLLGHTGCLEFFLAAFDGLEKVLELTPRASLPTST